MAKKKEKKEPFKIVIDGEEIEFKKITLDVMCDYIEKNHPEEKEWFKKVCYQNKKGEPQEKYNHLNAVRKFCEKYFELPPAAEPKVPATKRFENW